MQDTCRIGKFILNTALIPTQGHRTNGDLGPYGRPRLPMAIAVRADAPIWEAQEETLVITAGARQCGNPQPDGKVIGRRAAPFAADFRAATRVDFAIAQNHRRRPHGVAPPVGAATTILLWKEGLVGAHGLEPWTR